MNVLVIAANGRTGRKVVEQAIALGFKVTAFIRTTEKHSFSSSVTVIEGDATVYDDLAQAVRGQDIVVSAIGHIKGSSANLQTLVVENIIKAIESTGRNIKLVSLTGNGVRRPGDKVFLVDKIMNYTIKLVDPNRIRDGIEHARVIENSDINWVVVRVLKLTDKNSAGFRLSKNGPAKMFVSRQDTAKAMLEVAEGSKWDKMLPIISKQ